MQEIKYRSWDKFNEAMVYSVDFKNIAEYFIYCQKCIDGGNIIIQMQYIGRKDKNGVDIYEGDIVPLSFPNTETNAPIIYNEYLARFIPNSVCQTIYNFDFERCEVIGNICKNKYFLNY